MTAATPHMVGHPLRLLDIVLRARLLLVTAVAVAAHAGSVRTLGGGGTDWTFFTWGAQALLGEPTEFSLGASWFPGDSPGGFSLYANYSFLQIGPPAILLAAVLRLAPAEGLYLAGALVLALGLLAIVLLDRAFDDGSTGRRTTLMLGGAATAVTWVSLARFVHLDDALTLVAAVAACVALLRQHWLAVGLLTGFAAASKPWGVVAVALVLAAPSWRSRAGASLVAGAVVLAFWGPFLIGDPGTLALGDVRIRVSPDSVPALLGIDRVAANGPLRLAQMVGGLLIAAVLVLRGRWELALAAAFAWRLLLDPSPYAYYWAGLTTAVLLVDLTAWRRPLPALSLSVVVAWFAVSTNGNVTVQGVLHMVSFGGILVTCCGVAFVRRRSPCQPPPRSRATAKASPGAPRRTHAKASAGGKRKYPLGVAVAHCVGTLAWISGAAPPDPSETV